MLEARCRRPFGAPGKGGPAVLRAVWPKASAPQELHQRKWARQNQRPTSKTKSSDGEFITATRGFIADAFFGASSVVASALGTAPGATPARLIEHTMGGSSSRSKLELSTLLGTGTFYFALTKLTAEFTAEARRIRGEKAESLHFERVKFTSISVITSTGSPFWSVGV